MAIAYDIKVALQKLIRDRVGPDIEVTISRKKENLGTFISLSDVIYEADPIAFGPGVGRYEFEYYFDLDIVSGRSENPEDAEQKVWRLHDIVYEILMENPSISSSTKVRSSGPFAVETSSNWEDDDSGGMFVFALMATLKLIVWTAE